ncbi:ADP-ribosylglycohydrolase [Anaerococcus lactolyticus ATCC 51172]|uniref:ADP-ribosylglycohydrolase n=1 Tax=Anaerococcus lactolyticus ATCC 51172 TaxID=525254 RepID=C2BFV6_9FIRM|nr:ADP-ribosylglycohydrolase family protein [Anaerococcus lactolyticus]EEI86216.1 ADP-ribosylglycohydrolase [Anaerococcus lactolyticus ATCC 51172]
MENYKERIYAGLLGKAIGVRLGAPLETENWTKERIKESFGELNNYIKDSKRFAADDDTNGPIFFARALYDYGKPLTYEKISQTWLNYTRDGQGMFWWGGVGISSEDTAYKNLKKGILAPLSGSSNQNGKAISEQVGGQIFIDSWGLINLGDIDKAMKDAKIAASISHDGDGLIGAQFISACIAGAVYYDSTVKLVYDILKKLDQTSQYVKDMWKVYEFYLNNTSDYRLGIEYVYENFPNENYEGICHIIPNACIVLLGLLYSENDFSKAIEITVMSGLDTDSNAGVVGTIMGVMNGLDGIDWKYREDINDLIICSSFSPDLNITNIVDFTNFLWAIRTNCKYNPNILTFDFKGSSNGLIIGNDFRILRDLVSKNSENCYDVLVDNLVANDEASIYLKTNYLPKDFPDSRYDPIVMPHAYPGDRYSFEVSVEYLHSKSLLVNSFIELINGEIIKCSCEYELEDGEINIIDFTIPNTNSIDINKVGLMLTTRVSSKDGAGILARFKINKIRKKLNTNTVIKFKNQNSYFLNNVTPFSNNNISTKLLGDSLLIKAKDSYGIAISGSYYSENQVVKTRISNVEGDIFRIAFKVIGLADFYSFDIYKDKIKTYKNKFNTSILLDELEFDRRECFDIELRVTKDEAFLRIDNYNILSVNGIENEYGHFGFGGKNISAVIGDIHVEYS